MDDDAEADSGAVGALFVASSALAIAGGDGDWVDQLSGVIGDSSAVSAGG